MTLVGSSLGLCQGQQKPNGQGSLSSNAEAEAIHRKFGDCSVEAVASLAPTAAGTMLVTGRARGAPKPEAVINSYGQHG